MTVTGRRALALAAVALALAIGACGRKGPPVAPERRVPMPVSDLEGVLRNGVVELTWTAPRRRADNTRLIDPGVSRLYRTEDSGQGEPRPAMLVDDRIVGYKEIASFKLGDPAAPTAQRGRFTFTDRNLTLGHRYTYVVTSTDLEGRTSAPSRRLSLAIIAAPEAPEDVRAVPGDREVNLSWRPPTKLTDGGPVETPLIYEVLRAPGPDAPLAVVSRTEPGVTTALDGNLENDRVYYYAIRSVRREGVATAEGMTSARVSATPADITPPRAGHRAGGDPVGALGSTLVDAEPGPRRDRLRRVSRHDRRVLRARGLGAGAGDDLHRSRCRPRGLPLRRHRPGFQRPRQRERPQQRGDRHGALIGLSAP